MTLQTRPLALREKCRMMMFESRMFRKIFEPKWSKAIGQRRTMHNSLMICTCHQVLHEFKSRNMKWVGHMESMGRGEVHTGFWWGNLKERQHLEDLSVEWSIILKWVLK
jgi:hypothetical protein